MQKVLFIGRFSCGLKTLVDALLRKQVLTSSFVWGGNCLAKQVVSGDDGRCFVVKRDGIKEQINLAELKRVLTDNMLWRDAEYILYESSAQTDNLTFTIMYLTYEEEYLRFPCRQNDAVVYVLDVNHLFPQDDRHYIEYYLSDISNPNLFFCINHMDSIDEKYVSEVKKYTKEALKMVFTTNGIFDEALYQSRVFFISAYNSLNVRLGKPARTFSGAVYIKDIDTGVPEFEYTLRKFLQQQAITEQRAMVYQSQQVQADCWS